MMWAVRNSSSCTRLVKRVASLHPVVSPQSFVAHSGCNVRHFSSDDEYLTGKVKFYLKDKAYGFVIPDRDPTESIWIHRTSFDTPHSPVDFPSRPYLMKGERVRFRLEDAPPESEKSFKAIDLKFENGRQVPLYRSNYHASVVRGECRRLGVAVFTIVNDEKLSDEEKLEQIKIAEKTASEIIAQAAERQKMYGPEPDR